MNTTPQQHCLTALVASLFSMTAVPAHAQDGATTPVPATDTPAAANGAERLEAVTVTARRRSESSQNVPAPISTVSGADLERNREYRLQDLQQSFASFNVSILHPRQSSVAIRGLGNNPASDNLEPSVGIYLDNVYLGRPGMAVFDLFDIQQVDLLRGPQGTLFGKNATAGVLNITTRQPRFNPGGYLEQSIGNNGYRQTNAQVTGPLSETLAGSIGLVHTRSDGFVTNGHTGKKLNGAGADGVRGQLLWKPNDNLSARVIADYSMLDAHTGAAVVYGIPSYPGYTSPYRTSAASYGITPLNDPYGYTVKTDTNPHMGVNQGGISAEINYLLPGGYNLTAISAARFWNFTPANDGDGLPLPIIVNAGASVKDHQYSQEVRVASPSGGPVDWVAGAFYFYQQTTNDVFSLTGPVPYNTAARANAWTHSPSRVFTNSAALFGQGTYHLSERTDITAGIRATHEDKSGRVLRYASPTAPAYDSGPLGQNSVSPSGLLSISHKVTPDLLAYGLVSHSEKSGGITMAVASGPTLGAQSLLFGAERTNDAELGFKSDWFGHRLTVNGNLFWTQVHGYQATFLKPNDAGTMSTVLANAADVDTRGVELELRARPVRGLTLALNASYNVATYSDFRNAPCPIGVAQPSCDLSDQGVAGAPRWTGNVSAQYDFKVRGIDQYVAAGYAARSDQNGTLDNSPYSRIPGYGLANLATGWRFQSGQQRWDVSLWANNLFDKKYFLTVLSQNGYYAANTGDRRKFGATVRYTY
ncbi:TonB-dependent receptor [Pseudoduganella lutea]|uniref:TonB-dependent receptor n=1 Tax=Pseudoduganella lutea TaxID=321985 RepID=A0A4P6KWA1_9BURK|nr:TonB-dependent receptor [Pseudoduganella lutea]QBE62742.1 TonB-dependent receptor [Pseudoduganella lutea]